MMSASPETSSMFKHFPFQSPPPVDAPSAQEVQLQLLRINGDDKFDARVVEFDVDSELSVGRASTDVNKKRVAKPDNVQLTCPVISREHARFSAKMNGESCKLFLEDQSSHGTWVNGHQIPRREKWELEQDDSVQFGVVINREREKYVPPEFAVRWDMPKKQTASQTSRLSSTYSHPILVDDDEDEDDSMEVTQLDSVSTNDMTSAAEIPKPEPVLELPLSDESDIEDHSTEDSSEGEEEEEEEEDFENDSSIVEEDGEGEEDICEKKSAPQVEDEDHVDGDKKKDGVVGAISGPVSNASAIPPAPGAPFSFFSPPSSTYVNPPDGQLKPGKTGGPWCFAPPLPASCYPLSRPPVNFDVPPMHNSQALPEGTLVPTATDLRAFEEKLKNGCFKRGRTPNCTVVMKDMSELADKLNIKEPCSLFTTSEPARVKNDMSIEKLINDSNTTPEPKCPLSTGSKRKRDDVEEHDGPDDIDDEARPSLSQLLRATNNNNLPASATTHIPQNDADELNDLHVVESSSTIASQDSDVQHPCFVQAECQTRQEQQQQQLVNVINAMDRSQDIDSPPPKKRARLGTAAFGLACFIAGGMSTFASLVMMADPEL